MSSASPDTESVTVLARGFFCEHTHGKSRIFALVEQLGRQPSLSAVLTCTDANLAAQAAAALTAACQNGSGPAVHAELDRIAALLPAAPRASLRSAAGHAHAGTWPPNQDAPIQPAGITDTDDAEHVPPAANLDMQRRTSFTTPREELPGPVVHVARDVELHVHDVPRLLRAATAAGWTPDSEEDRDPDDPDDVLGAAMWFATTELDAPGIDTITDGAEAELLRADSAAGDTDRADTPGATIFHGGWRRRPAAAMPVPEPDESVLDFAVYEDDAWPLTPRTAALLHSELASLADAAYNDIDSHSAAPIDQTNDHAWELFDRLPPLSWHHTDREWRRQIARTFDDLAGDLAAGLDLVPRCNAEELALHLAIDDARDTAHDLPELLAEITEGLPTREDDYDFDGCSEALFQDHDILMLYNAQEGPLADPAHPVNRFSGMGDLRPDQWFTPFLNVETRPSDRPYRR